MLEFSEIQIRILICQIQLSINVLYYNSNNKYFVLPTFFNSGKMERPHKFGHGKIICSAAPITDVKDSFSYLH